MFDKNLHIRAFLHGNAYVFGLLAILLLTWFALSLIFPSSGDMQLFSDSMGIAITFLLLPIIIWDIVTTYDTYESLAINYEGLKRFYTYFAEGWVILTLYAMMVLNKFVKLIELEPTAFLLCIIGIVAIPVTLHINLYLFKIHPTLSKNPKVITETFELTEEDREWMRKTR